MLSQIKLKDSNIEDFMAQHLTIVMAQLNFLVGDIEGNTDLVIELSLIHI